MNNKIIENLMKEAIEYKRLPQIQRVCLPVWNQPFFYKIDKAKVITLSYNPTDKGARTNYPYYVRQYTQNGYLDTNTILDILYNFKKEEYWRKNYDLIFNIIGIDEEEIAHMDVSFFPYKTLNDYKNLEYLDDTKQFLLKTVDLLSNQLKYIFIDGARNRDILYKIINKDYSLIDRTQLPVNNSGHYHDLLIYKHNIKDLYVIYFGCFLYGSTCPSSEKMKSLAYYIKEKTK